MNHNRLSKLIVFSPLFAAFIAGIFIFFHSCQHQNKKEETKDQYAGSESCKECHERFYKLWEPSHHGKAMQPISAGFIAENLSHFPEWVKVEEVLFRVKSEDGNLIYQEKNSDGKITDYKATYAMGGKNIYYFMTELERGKLQTLPLAFDVHKKEWYNTQQSAMRHFSDEERTDEALPWKHYLYTFNTTCHDCHVSQMTKNYDIETDSYQLTWKEPGINCEACHGPSKEHIRVCREAALKGEEPKDLKLISWKHFSHEQSDATCSACHAKMSPLTKGYAVGEPFYDHFSLITLENVDYYPDGRDLGENYTYTSWSQSPCVQANADMDCVTCHTSSGRYRFQDKDFNQACMPCHKDKVENITAHSHHSPEGRAGKCISCHMPKTDFARMKRSDHSMRPPMPAASIAFGSPNACTICHTDKSNQWADKEVRKWHKKDYQAETIKVGQWIKDARDGKWDELSNMMRWIQKNPKKEIFVNSLVRLMEQCDNPKKWPLMYDLFENHPSALVRSSAIANIGMDRESKKAKQTLVKALDDSVRLVRRVATTALSYYPIDSFDVKDREKVQTNLLEYEEAMVIRPDDWVAHYNLGNYYSQQGNHHKALKQFKISNTLFDEAVIPLVNGGYTSALLGDHSEAERMLRKALSLEPNNEAANLNYALLLGELGRVDEAQACYQKVLEVNPSSAIAAFNMAVIVGQRDLHGAIKYSQVAYDNASDNPKYGYTYAYYLVQDQQQNKAVEVMKGVLSNHPTYLDGWFFLSQVYEQQGQYSKAVDVCKKALKVEGIPYQAQQGFQQRIEMLQRNR